MSYNIHQRGLTPHKYNDSQQEPIEESVDYSPIEEYLSSYFDGTLAEDVSGDDIVTALEELIDIAELADHYLVEIGERMVKRLGAAVKRTEEPGTSHHRRQGVSQKKYDQGKRVTARLSKRTGGRGRLSAAYIQGYHRGT